MNEKQRSVRGQAGRLNALQVFFKIQQSKEEFLVSENDHESTVTKIHKKSFKILEGKVNKRTLRIHTQKTQALLLSIYC